MKAVLQRVRSAAVTVRENGGEEETGAIGQGLAVLLGVARGDTAGDAAALAGKIARLRVFEDEGGKLNLSLLDTGGAALVVSNFTLCGDCRRGNRPDFGAAAPFGEAKALYEAFTASLIAAGVPCENGRFGAEMRVKLDCDGPVTLLLDTNQ